MGNRKWTKALGLVVAVTGVAAGTAYVQRTWHARHAEAVVSTPTLAAAEGDGPQHRPRMSELSADCPAERGAAHAERIVPIVAKAMELTAEEEKRALEIMVARNKAQDAVDVEQGWAASMKVDKDSREQLATLLGAERGKEFHKAFFAEAGYGKASKGHKMVAQRTGDTPLETKQNTRAAAD